MKVSEELRKAVLQAAMQGKLTEQLPEDGNASELLEQIRAEKEQLINNKKIKKEKPLAPICEDETLFDIPENWEWVYLGEIFQHNTGKALNSKNSAGTMLSYITTSNVYWNRFELEKIKEMPFTESEIEKCTVRKGDLLVCEGGDVGRSAIWPYEDEVRIQNHIHRLRAYLPVCTKFFLNVLYFLKTTNQLNGVGIGIQGFSSGALHSVKTPLPPLAEQERIVAKVDELMALIDELEKTENELEEIRKAFPQEMKASILQAAMQGKLIEQLPEDNTAEELMQQSKDIKDACVRNKEIKKEAIDNIDETPFDIPDSWQWSRLGNVANLRMGKTPPRAETEHWGNDYPWVSIADMIANGHIKTTAEGISKSGCENKFKGKVSPSGTLLMSFKLTIGRVSILDMDALHNEAIVSIFPYVNDNNIFRDYLFKVLPYLTQYGESKNAIKGNTLNSKSLNNLLIPVPPLAEQERIVEKLDKLLPMCDKFEELYKEA